MNDTARNKSSGHEGSIAQLALGPDWGRGWLADHSGILGLKSMCTVQVAGILRLGLMDFGV